MRQNENLRAHPQNETTHNCARKPKDLLLVRCADGGQRREQTSGDCSADTRPRERVVEHVTNAGSHASGKGEAYIFGVLERIRHKQSAPPVRRWAVLGTIDDLFALTQYRTDPELAEILVRRSRDTATWVARQGVKLQPGLGRQAYQVDGKFKFWGGLALHIWGGGAEMLKALYANVERRGIAIAYETPVVALLREDGRVTGVVAEAMVCLTLARCYREKFGGDHIDDVLAAVAAYKRRIDWRQ